MLTAGDRAGALRQLDTLEQILRDELGIGLSPEAYDLRVQALDTPVDAPRPARPPMPRHAGLTQQLVHFCRTSDGVRLAYATSGAGPPLVKTSNWLTHLDYDWASPVWSHWWRALSEGRLLVRYDERGCGLIDVDAERSQPNPSTPLAVLSHVLSRSTAEQAATQAIRHAQGSLPPRHARREQDKPPEPALGLKVGCSRSC